MLINSGLSAWGSRDILFRQLNLMIPNFFIYISVISFIYISVILFLIEKNIKVNQYWISVSLLLFNPYLFLIHLSGLRQTLAICFFILAVHFGIKRNLIMYLVFILVSVGFHSSAIFLLPIYLILNDKPFSKRELTLSFLVTILLLFTPLFDVIANKLFEFLPTYEHYYEMGLQNSIRSTMISSFFYLFVVLNIDKLKGKELVYGKLSLIGTMLSVLTLRVSMISRVEMYFNVFLILTIPHILDEITSKRMKYVFLLIIISLYLLRYVSFFTTPLWESYFNYKTILTN